MPDWWTYQPRDLLMFSPETYYRLFELHNAELWPAQVLAFIGGLAILAMLVRRPPWAGRTISTLLAAAWACVGFAYFFERYATINLAAPYFGWTFLVQALLILAGGVLAGRLRFDKPITAAGKAGFALFFFGLLVQPLMGPLLVRLWPGLELFAIAPDPTTMATLGILLAADRIRWELLVIPVLWCGVTGATLATMGAPEALLMPAAGLLAILLAAYRSLTGDSAES
ncbi:MAG TPA: DUF6064 family protein [Methyloceanibacter sp.]|nr:DUF6064 family protein [Methyloceanibacter sp.]